MVSKISGGIVHVVYHHATICIRCMEVLFVHLNSVMDHNTGFMLVECEEANSKTVKPESYTYMFVSCIIYSVVGVLGKD